MSFGEGDLHAQVDRLKGVNGELFMPTPQRDYDDLEVWE